MTAAASSLPRHGATLDPTVAVRWGVVAALTFHIGLLLLLSLNWPSPEQKRDNLPLEVDLIVEAAPVATAPQISTAPPPPKLGAMDEPPTTEPPPPKAPEPKLRQVPARAPPTKTPPPKSAPPKAAPTTAPPTKATPTKTPRTKAALAKALPTKAPPTKANPAPQGRPNGAPQGVTNAPPTKAPPAPLPPATQTAAEVRKSIDVAIDGKILPHWRRNVPSGIEIDQLRVVLQIRLNPDGSVADVRQLGELTGKTDSNRPQQALFVERAIRSIRQASPFNLPVEYYDQWRAWDVTFRARGI